MDWGFPTLTDNRPKEPAPMIGVGDVVSVAGSRNLWIACRKAYDSSGAARWLVFNSSGLFEVAEDRLVPADSNWSFVK